MYVIILLNHKPYRFGVVSEPVRMNRRARSSKDTSVLFRNTLIKNKSIVTQRQAEFQTIGNMDAEEDEHINLASKLLNSTDERVAAAAKRIFANAFTVESSFPNGEMQTIPLKTNPQSSINHLISSDVFDAASMLLAPKNTHKSSNVMSSRDLTPIVTQMESNPQESIQPDSLAPSSKKNLKKIQIDADERLHRRYVSYSSIVLQRSIESPPEIPFTEGLGCVTS